MTPDPLSEKYYGLSPYNYCGGNPISQKDTNGKEIIDGLCDSNEEKKIVNIEIRKYMKSCKDFPSVIQIFSHGNSKGFRSTSGKFISTAKSFMAYLDISSEVWLNNCLANQKNIIILHSCSTGHGEESFAQRMSKDIPNTLIFAPSDDIRIDNNKETVKNGGTWNAFVGGDKICASKIHPIIMLQIILKIQQLCAEKLNMKN